MTDLISIILPVYNAENHIKKCIKSILSQTYQKFELIIINDGSRDNSLNIINTFNDKRIILINKNNEGVSKSRNIGIKKSIGNFIYFIDSDDWIEPNLIETCIRTIQSNNTDILFFGYFIHVIKNDVTVSTKKMIFDKLFIKHKRNINFFLDEKNIGMMGYVWNKFYRKNIITSHNLLFDNTMSLFEDVVFNFNYFMYAANIIVLNDTLYHHNNNNNLESLSKKYIINEFTMSKKMFLKIRSFLIYWGAKETKINNILSKIVIKSIKHNIHTIIKYNNSNYKIKIKAISKIINDVTTQKYVKIYKSKSFFDYVYFILIKYKAPKLIYFLLKPTK